MTTFPRPEVNPPNVRGMRQFEGEREDEAQWQWYRVWCQRCFSWHHAGRTEADAEAWIEQHRLECPREDY